MIMKIYREKRNINKEHKLAISKYIKISVNTLLLLAMVTALFVVLVSSYFTDLSLINSIKITFLMFFKILSYTFAVLFVIVGIDSEDLKITNCYNKEINNPANVFLNMLYNNNYKAKLEIYAGLVSSYFFLLIGMMGKWLDEEFDGKIPLSNYCIVFFIVIAFLSGLIKFYLLKRRKSRSPVQIENDIKNLKIEMNYLKKAYTELNKKINKM